MQTVLFFAFFQFENLRRTAVLEKCGNQNLRSRDMITLAESVSNDPVPCVTQVQEATILAICLFGREEIRRELTAP